MDPVPEATADLAERVRLAFAAFEDHIDDLHAVVTDVLVELSSTSPPAR